MHVTRLETPRCRGGENPLWDTAEQALYFIDNTGKRVHRHDPAAGSTRSWHMPRVVSALALRQTGGAVVTLGSEIHFLDLETGGLERIPSQGALPPPAFNDGKVDRRGRLLLGGCTTNFGEATPDGGLYSLDAGYRFSQLDTDIRVSNGPCFSPDDETFYFSDSLVNTTYRYDYDIETGAATGRRRFVETNDLGGRPDGSTVDRDGLVWMAIYGAGKVAAFRPDGRLERIVEMPVRLVSSVMFGGPGLDRLYVTSIGHGTLGEPAEEGAGYVYAIDGLGAHGVPEPRYSG